MNQVKAGAVLNYVIIVLNAMVGLLYTPFMLRCLGQSEYGLYSLVASIIAYLTLLDFGFGPTVIRYAAKFIAEGKTWEQFSLYGLFFRLYSIIGIIAFAVGLLLYFNIDWFFDRTMTVNELSQAKTMIMLLLFNLAITFPMSIFGSIINAYERFIFQKVVVIGRILLSTAVLILILYLGYKAVALVIVQTVFNVVLLTVNFLYCRRNLKIRLIFEKFDWKFIRELLGFSVWVFVGDIMFKFYYSTGQFVLGAISGTTAVAIFALGVTLMHMYIMFSNGISGVLLPRITAMVSRKCSDKEISEIFIKVGRLQFIIIGLILGGFIVFGRTFIRIWAGVGYEEVYIIGIIFFSSTLIPLIQSTGIIILQARNKLKFRAIMLLIVSTISLLTQICLSIKWGAVGCAIAVGLANLIGQGLILNWYYSKHQKIDISRFWIEIGKMCAVPIVLSCIMSFLFTSFSRENLTSLAIWICGYTVIYLILCWIFSLNSNEKTLFLDPIKRLFKNKLC